MGGTVFPCLKAFRQADPVRLWLPGAGIREFPGHPQSIQVISLPLRRIRFRFGSPVSVAGYPIITAP